VSLENCAAVLETARYKSKADVARLVASLAPKRDVPALVRKLPRVAASSKGPGARHSQRTDAQPSSATVAVSSAAGVITPPMRQPPQVRAGSAPPIPPVTPLAPERYKLQLTISRETYERLQRVQALVRHTLPDGDLAAIVDRALTLLLDDLERRRCGAVGTPRESPRTNDRTRHIPAAVRREVWRRDAGRCAFVGRSGRRCAERAFLEFHHVQPYADGGPATVANIQLRCRAHNAHEARLLFEQAPAVREARPTYAAR
jgi:5-methylcytosine-specific restriction endonuclease McrA